jgi:hypothetical protein
MNLREASRQSEASILNNLHDQQQKYFSEILTPPPRNSEMTLTAGFAGRRSSKGLLHILFRQSSTDFEFIVGEHHDFCNQVITAFLSPRIADRQSSDSTSASYWMVTHDQEDCFKTCLSLGYGEGNVVNKSFRICQSKWAIRN